MKSTARIFNGAAGVRTSSVSPRKIAMVIPAMDLGGMEMMVLSLSHELRALGHDARILCTEAFGTLERRVRDAGVPIEKVPAPGVWSLVRPTRLAAYLGAEGFDVVHSHSGVNAKAARAARMAGIGAIVHTLHGVQYPLAIRELAVMLLGTYQTNINVGCSVDALAFYEKWLPWSTHRRELVANGIELTWFNDDTESRSLREELGISADSLILGTVARLDAVKNQELLIESLRCLDDRWRVVFVGSGPREAMLRDCATKHGVAHRVHFAGARTADCALYSAFDVFALTSLSEAMPMTILEAFAARIPVVATAVGGIPSLLEDGALGRLVPLGAADAFAAAVTAVVRDTERTREMTSNAWERLQQKYTVGSMARAYLSLYETLLVKAAS